MAEPRSAKWPAAKARERAQRDSQPQAARREEPSDGKGAGCRVSVRNDLHRFDRARERVVWTGSRDPIAPGRDLCVASRRTFRSATPDRALHGSFRSRDDQRNRRQTRQEDEHQRRGSAVGGRPEDGGGPEHGIGEDLRSLHGESIGNSARARRRKQAPERGRALGGAGIATWAESPSPPASEAPPGRGLSRPASRPAIS